MAQAVRLGVLTPSSNTVLEPLYAAMLAGTGATAHFARFRVTAINLGPDALAQFDPAPMLEAAALLADARVQSICWSGTSGGWLGLEADRRLCAAIADRTGIPACTSTLALVDALRRLGARRIALVSPYLADVQRAILGTLAREGFECAAERHLDDPGNYSFALHDDSRVAALVREVAPARPDAVAIYCTNFRGAASAAALEAELGIPVLDSVATGLWAGLRQAGMDPAPLRRWGSLFASG